ncbi:MAG TPA: hypothetical protein VF070_34745 [Streptosporangiaceae bacterium]
MGVALFGSLARDHASFGSGMTASLAISAALLTAAAAANMVAFRRRPRLAAASRGRPRPQDRRGRRGFE